MKMEFTRLIEQQPNGVEHELLAAGKRDAMPAASRRAIFLGLGLPFAPLGLDASVGTGDVPVGPGDVSVGPGDTSAGTGGLGHHGMDEVPGPELTTGSGGAASSPVANTGLQPLAGVGEQAALQQAGFGALAKSVLVSKSFMGLVGAGAIGAALWAGQGTAPPDESAMTDDAATQVAAPEVSADHDRDSHTASVSPSGASSVEPDPAPSDVAAADEAELDLAPDAEDPNAENPDAEDPDAENPDAEDSESEPSPPRRAGSNKTAGGLSQELVLIEGARNALRTGNSRLALRRLDDYRSKFGKGRLRAEETMLRIEALSASGDRAGAARLGKAVLARSPNGPYSRRIRSLLGDAAD